jgi:hypothetical protein
MKMGTSENMIKKQDGQEQKVNNGSIAIQAGGDVSLGISVTEARQIALDLWKANFIELSANAKEIADTRVQEITDKVLEKLQREFPAGIEKAEDPDFQYALFTVQKEYARNGDENLGDLLVDLLVDRSKLQQRDILQIVLNESLNTAPKLTESQLAALSVIFQFKYTQNLHVGNHKLLGDYFDRTISPFISSIVKNRACYQHLEFTGCGSIGFVSNSLESILCQTYQGQFLKGFENKEIIDRGVTIGNDQRFFIPCLNDPTKVQIRANNKEMLEKAYNENEIPAEDRIKISQLFDLNKMSETEIQEKCISIRPYMAELFDKWSHSELGNFSLTSVGIAIGHANIKRLSGEFADLSIWIN